MHWLPNNALHFINEFKARFFIWHIFENNGSNWYNWKLKKKMINTIATLFFCLSINWFKNYYPQITATLHLLHLLNSKLITKLFCLSIFSVQITAPSKVHFWEKEKNSQMSLLKFEKEKCVVERCFC